MKRQERVPMIDALRGLSCLGILLYHVRVDLWIGWVRIRSYPNEYSSFAKAMAWLSVPTPFLGYAILLFFLISGFCIHYPQAAGSNPDWKNYFIRRFFRIYPPYLIALGLTALITYIAHVQWSDNTWDPERIWRVLTLTQNYPPGAGQLLSNPSLWTIPLEMEFYLLYPLAFLVFSRLRSPVLWLTSLSFCGCSIWLSYQGTTWTSFTALFFWPVWLLGTWLAQLYHDGMLKKIPLSLVLVVGAASLVFALASKLHHWQSWLQYFLWTGFYFCLFVFTIRQSGFLENKNCFRLPLGFLSWLGRISFSVYLIHFPLFKLMGYLHRSFFGEKPANFLFPLAYLLVACGLGWIFYRTIERPVHLWSKKRIGK